MRVQQGDKSTQKKSRRKGPSDIERDRKSRGQKAMGRRPVIAQWNGAILAESSDYEVCQVNHCSPQETPHE